MQRWYRENNIVPTNYSSFTGLAPFEELALSYVPSIAPTPIRPSLAYSCLKSVPLNQSAALAYIEYLRPMIEWHSALDYLQSPPKGYLSEGVDLGKGLTDIAAKLKSSGYKNEFEWLADLHTLINVRARDGHLGVHSPLLTGLFLFKRGVKFVSISKDGRSPPQVFLRDDAKHAQNGYSTSPAASIDDVPAVEYLQRKSTLAAGHMDPDARYNTLFQSLAKEASPYYLDIDHDILGLRDATRVKLSNGTVLNIPNVAYVIANFTDVTSGADVYQKWTAKGATGELGLPGVAYPWLARNFTNSLPGFPAPSHRTFDAGTAGFLPSSPPLSNVAVLSVSTFAFNFVPNITLLSGERQFRYDTTLQFLRAAKAAGKTKLILDLQTNSGGIGVNLLGLHSLLFPGTRMSLIWQHRAHAQLAWLANYADASGCTGWECVEPPYSLEAFMQPDGTPWANWTQHYGPVNNTWGSFTRDALWDEKRWLDDEFLGIKRDETWTEAPFKPEDIVILLDGECGSACAITVAALVHGNRVRTVVVGGRPMEAPMQGVGQVKGGVGLPFPGSRSPFDPEVVPEGLSIYTGHNPPIRIDATLVNEANMFPVGSKSDIPLHFTYEAANCKLFFTWDALTSVEALWKQVADVAWKGGKCVKGSTTEKNDKMGGVPAFRKGVEDKYSLGEGPGSVAR
ncbi:hypothetical protein QBC34DRAFT_478567 [Podospora aff. communis PSN243]|uniref:CPAF-like PDZ domain-containing protein n=1 Tax=Podospora aff. communis PSN243 TaxID=3040156 RepID=A0AAV9G6G8_9PEZI|nr:hypothetical protein QBC34DRAFT_478567 [Podospora aff. communis PSN243]